MSKEPTEFESNKIMEQILKKSKGKTIDLVVDHELYGVTPEMIDWWWDNIDTIMYNLSITSQGSKDVYCSPK